MNMSRDKVIVQYIRDHAGSAGGDIANALESEPYRIPRTTTFSYLTQLVKQKVLARKGDRRSYTYSVSEDS